MRFTPLTPDRLADELATWVESLLPGRTRVGIDGATEIGATDLADAVAEQLRSRGRPVVRASTVWWWRPASLRLEYGHRDVDMLLTGWVDSGSLRRELLDPLASGGSGDHLARLRDPATDRSLREPRSRAEPGTILLLDGPLPLMVLEKQVNAWIAAQKAGNVGAGALTRPAERSSASAQSPN